MAGKRLKCPLCDRLFAKRDHVDRHMRSHTKEKPFKCSQCRRSYGRNDTLLRHLRDHENASSSSWPAAATVITNPFLSLGSVSTEHNSSLSQSAAGNALTDSDDFPATDAFDFANDQSGYQALYNQPATFGAPYPSWMVPDDFLLELEGLGLPFSRSDESQDSLHPAWKYAACSANGNGPTDTENSWASIQKDVSHMWFTKIQHSGSDSPPMSRTQTPAAARAEVDDNYWRTLHNRLSFTSQEQQLPSTMFLNTCVRLYFLRFHAIFPIFHAPTFRPSRANARLVLSICAIGCLYTGAPDAPKLSSQLFESLQKSSMSKWEAVLTGDFEEAVAMVHSALLGQMFALLSGDGRHLAQLDALSGAVISWARRCKLFSACHTPLDVANLSEEALNVAWHSWIRTETHVRACTGLYIHDAEVASIFHHEPILRHDKRQLSRPSFDSMFMAANAEEWRQQALQYAHHESLDPRSPLTEDAAFFTVSPQRLFATYQVLEDIIAIIMDKRLNEQLDALAKNNIMHRLLSAHQQFFATSLSKSNSFDLHILWHLAFMTLYTDTDLLERAIGRDGLIDQLSAARVQRWAESLDAIRCAIHGALIIQILESLSLKHEPALHTPRATFFAGIIWYCYAVYAPPDHVATTQDPTVPSFPEFKLLGINEQSLLFEAQGFSHGRPISPGTNGVLCGAADILRRIGHSGISKRLSSILSEIIHTGPT